MGTVRRTRGPTEDRGHYFGMFQWAILVDEQCWVSELCTPALLDEGASHLAFQPPVLQPVQLVMIRASGRQASVCHETAVSIQG